MLDIMMHNLVSPAVLFFILGLIAALVKSDLKFPQALSDSLSIYLLVAIGLKGGIELSGYLMQTLILPILGTLLLGCSIPVLTFAVCRWLKLDRYNAAALAATYGSVSIVTFGAATAYLQHTGVAYESYMSAMVVVLESPAILISLLLLRLLQSGPDVKSTAITTMGIIANPQPPVKKGLELAIIKESLFGKSILLMVGAMIVGLIVGKGGMPAVKPLFVDLYGSILMIFLLGMGLSAGERLSEMKQHGFKLVGLAVAMPLVYGTLGVLIGWSCGLSMGGTMLMGVLGASASYIAAPAALRQSVPEANPSIYLGMSLGITFPFNLIIGLPLFAGMAQWLHGLT